MRSDDPDRDDERRLDLTKVPEPLWWLIPLVQRWSIGDDSERSAAVDMADDADLVGLVRAVDTADDDVLYGWLSGPEWSNPTPTDEYVAFTCMTMAADEARLRVQRAHKPGSADAN